MRLLRRFCNIANRQPLRILGIETSCDDTGAAVIEWCQKERTPRVLSETLHSQLLVHLAHGGIVPPVAQNLHEKHIENVVTSCMEKSGICWSDLSAIAVTNRPGMPLSLKVGLVYAKDLVRRYKLPLIPVHHMQAHALTVRLQGIHGETPKFPFLVLLISGGHALLTVAQDVDKFILLGRSLDISPGDCLDKFARRAKLKNAEICRNVSGGHAVEIMARGGNPFSYTFKNIRMHHRDCDFSFSGLQSYGIRIIDSLETAHSIPDEDLVPNIKDVCSSMQHTLSVNICRRLQRAIVYSEVKGLIPPDLETKTVVVSGGVASNAYIRHCLKTVTDYYGYELVCPPARLCTDNGVMIAWNGIELARENKGVITDVDDLDFQSRCLIGKDYSDDVRNSYIKPDRLKFSPPNDH